RMSSSIALAGIHGTQLRAHSQDHSQHCQPRRKAQGPQHLCEPHLCRAHLLRAHYYPRRHVTRVSD
ncbi:hypothetical protein, partial [Proteus vulgaris]|uniref:hypothetical protein n=1 Tax=Proteus vulgaris TaxID=585 RepID=UPI001EF9208C